MLCHERYFKVWENRGIHITPVHYYQPIPDTRMLESYPWAGRSDMAGIDMNTQEQIQILTQFSSQYRNEYGAFPFHKTSNAYQFYVNNGTFESVDCEILYCMIRQFKPKTIIEIGAGNSTYLAAQAVLANKEKTGVDTNLISIEPYPKDTIKAGIPGLSELIEKSLENVDFSIFSELTENDILFIDSSHVLKTGNDVQKIYLEILPSLKKGVLIHIHDIYFPSEYPRTVILDRYRFWTEQYLVQAFLAFNNAFKILWGGSFMHLNHPEKLETAFSSYNRNERWPGSFWIRKTE
jgi:predicted O-methyltransferase YrrM